jgi:hypothetical protein
MATSWRRGWGVRLYTWTNPSPARSLVVTSPWRRNGLDRTDVADRRRHPPRSVVAIFCRHAVEMDTQPGRTRRNEEGKAVLGGASPILVYGPGIEIIVLIADTLMASLFNFIATTQLWH